MCEVINKICKKCGVEKLLDQFSKDRSTRDGLRGYCKDCGRQYWKAHSRENRDKLNAAERNRRAENPKKIRARVQKSYLKNTFGMTVQDRDSMIAAQGGKCAICQDVFISSFHTHIDHAHGSDPVIVRGILCSRCNTGLGHFKDSPERILRAVQYLQKFQA